MTAPRTYSTAAAFRIALEARLQRIAREELTDIQRVRRQVAFDRLLVRLFAQGDSRWALKGGYAMELRLREARATKDIDLTLKDYRSLSGAGETMNDYLRSDLQEEAAFDAGDFFVFLIGEAMMDIDAAPYGGARYPVDARIDGKTFVKFHIDVGVGDHVLEPLEIVTARDWLEFVGVKPLEAALISKEQQFAEKLHAYTLPDRPAPNSRVKDLVDMALLIRLGGLDAGRVRTALDATFKRRATHAIPETLTEPAPGWEKPFAELARECGLETDMDSAYKLLRDFHSSVNRNLK